MTRTLLVFAAALAAGAALADGDRSPRAERVERMFEALDADGDGRITPAEAEAHGPRHLQPAAAPIDRAAFVAEAQERAAERAGRMFDRLDSDANGELDAAELAERRRGRIDGMFRRLDADDDGAITREEAEAAGPWGRRGHGWRG